MTKLAILLAIMASSLCVSCRESVESKCEQVLSDFDPKTALDSENTELRSMIDDYPQCKSAIKLTLDNPDASANKVAAAAYVAGKARDVELAADLINVSVSRITLAESYSAIALARLPRSAIVRELKTFFDRAEPSVAMLFLWELAKSDPALSEQYAISYKVQLERKLDSKRLALDKTLESIIRKSRDRNAGK